MYDWFNIIARDCELSENDAQALHDLGYVVISGPVASERLSQLAAAYDAAVLAAAPDDVGNGSTSTRVQDFVNRGQEFDDLYVYPPILKACCSLIGGPFHLSTMLARTVNPGAHMQRLHTDYPRQRDRWPMVGFIFMVDEFRSDNGATRFVPGSHLWTHGPGDVIPDTTAEYESQVAACGPAGSVVIYNGSVWHGHGANQTRHPRRSIQGSYICRDDKQAVNQAARIQPDTLERIGGLAKYILHIESQSAVLPTSGTRKVGTAALI